MPITRASLKAFLAREHTLDVPVGRLTRVLVHAGAQRRNFAEHLEDLVIAIAPGILTASGRFHHNEWSGRFLLRLRPVRVIWETQRHALVFQILDHDIRFDRSLKGLVAAIGLAAVNGLFGKNYLLRKLAVVLDEDRVQLELDRLDPRLQPLLDAVALNRIECVENALRLCFRAHPGRVLRSCGRCVRHWFTRPAGQKPRNTETR